MKSLKICSLVLALTAYQVNAGTVTLSASGVSSSPIFVTSTLSTLTVGTQFNLGTFKDVSALNSIITTYKAGVVGTGDSTANAQADANAKKTQLYNDTVTWLSSSVNFIDIASTADSITQTGTTAAGKILFNVSNSRSVNGVNGNYAGVTGNFTYTYANYPGGANAKLWAWYGTGSEIGIVTDTTWFLPTNNASGLTIGSANLSSTGSGDATELLLASYTDYGSGSDLISSLAITQTLNVVPPIPEASTMSLFAISILGLSAMRKRKSQKVARNE